MKDEKYYGNNNINIVNALRKNENIGYDTIYSMMYPPVERFVLENSGACSDAKDVFQDTMLVLFKKITDESLDSLQKQPICAIIMKIAKNIWFHQLRKINAAEVMRLDDIPIAAEPAIIYSNDGNEDECILFMMKVLRNMSSPYKQVLETYFRNNDQKKNAKFLKYSYSYYRKTMTIAKQKLAAIMKDDPYLRGFFRSNKNNK